MAKQGSRVVISGLTKSFGDVAAVSDLSFAVEPGSVVGFLGPNGAGKSTTLRMLVGLIRPDAGSATIGGRPYTAMPSPTAEVGAVLDAQAFQLSRTGRSHLRIYCTASGLPRRRADEALELVDLAHAGHRTVQTYSLGMRQRLALATALLCDPPVLVLDEPANGLDPEGIVWMRRLLRDYAASGRTILVSSHVLGEVQQLVDRVVIINKGRLVREGAIGELVAWHRSPVRIRSSQADRLEEALRRRIYNGVEVQRMSADRLRITGLDVADVGRLAFAEQVEVLELGPEESDLEQIFFSLTGSEIDERRGGAG
jgi:ABC-2 type transport system ATP-binding protein